MLIKALVFIGQGFCSTWIEMGVENSLVKMIFSQYASIVILWIPITIQETALLADTIFQLEGFSD
jgi:hypothetical protein